MKLYELTQCYNNLLDLIENPEVPKEMLENSLQNIEDEFSIKAENLCKVIKTIEIQAKGIKEEEKRLADRRKALENKVENLKEYLDINMKLSKIDKIKGDIFTLSIQKNPPSVAINDLKAIPKEYFIEVEPSLDKKALLKDLKEGKEIKGAEIKQTKSLRIR